MDGELEGEVGERLKLPKEDEAVKHLRDPKLPTQEEVDRHYITGHILFRDWCPVCVKSQGKELDHTRDKGKERKLPEYAFDYCFLGDELGYKWTVLVGKERGCKSWMAEAVPVKGVGSGRFIVDRCLDFIKENGDAERDILIKTDQEPAIQLLIKEVVEARAEGKTLVEESPVKFTASSSGSAGVVERAVQEMEGKIRAIFLGLEERLGRQLDARERIVAFIPEYAAYLMNKLFVGEDGKVAYERVKGKKPSVLGIEFGEKVLYKVKRGAKLEKIKARWDYGIFVGVRKVSNELMVATQDKVVMVRSVRRVPFEKRWSEDCVR